MNFGKSGVEGIFKRSYALSLSVLSVLCINIVISCLSGSMVKCAAYSCRSGYRPTVAEKRILNKGGLAACKRSVFVFPKDPVRRARRISVVRRGDTEWNPEHCGVCELHFRDDDFCQGTQRKDERKQKFLKVDAVPSVFDAYPE